MREVVGILLVTHGNLGRELLNTCELIMGKQQNVITLSLKYGDSVEKLRQDVKRSIQVLNHGRGVLVLTDLFGGSPSNVVAHNMRELDFKCLSGVNLPMLIEAFNFRDSCNLDELIEKTYKAGSDGIKNLGEVIGL